MMMPQNRQKLLVRVSPYKRTVHQVGDIDRFVKITSFVIRGVAAQGKPESRLKR